MLHRTCLAIALATLALPTLADEAKKAHTPTAKELLAKASPVEWRTPDPQNLVYMDLPQGRVIIELAQDWSPEHAANIRTLIREHYFDGTAVIRVQDNFVTQWGDPDGDDKAKAKSLGTAKQTLPPEFTRKLDKSIPFAKLPDGDVYAPEVGFSDGFPAARDTAHGQAWLTHCYGAVGVARDVGAETGNGSSLYAIIGQAPRNLDRNLAVAGRVIQGMPILSAYPRGGEPMGFYDKPEQRVTIKTVRLAADVPEAERTPIQVLRTDSKTFTAVIDAKRNRKDDFYTLPAGKIDICNISIPVRDPTKKAP
ncbi:cyclophilin family peptidyl-prolyl cis-trans isomerase [Luteibacter rhizovicinus]|uniref:peptidylprolyl isomerase n=1 Tax=Luteibacter rhizovicinus TaxID=242606 RepID=A0A4R3YVF3_9GAMM|nr:peptidylprolyl isomerase [Luteibacter rhizovicinus]TCV97085.1 cyclophilin family peptidyl-prolyl cis-trans isomerase [Luteibacter rhizovicinus]